MGREMFLRKIFNITILTAMAVLMTYGSLLAGIAATPERHILELMPGEAAYVEYQVYNGGTEPVEMIIEPQDLVKINENKDIDITSWLKPKEDKIIVEPGKPKVLGIDINVPKDAIGELNSMIYLCYKEQKDSILNIRYGIPLYVFIKGTENIKAEIESVKIGTLSSPHTPQQKNMIISIDVKNTGNRHIRPKVWAVVKDLKSKRENEITLDNPWPVFGGQSYLYNITWDNYSLEPGEYIATAFFEYGKDNILEYSASFNINEKGEVTESKKE